MFQRMTIVLILWWAASEILLHSCCYRLPRGSEDVAKHRNEDALKRLLRVFGLDGRVPQKNGGFSLPPQYMLDLYKSYSETSTTEQELRYRGTNTVRSFFNKELPGGSSHNGLYFYDLQKSIPAYEEIVDAEFHLFTNFNALRLQPSSHVIQIHLYEEQKNGSSKLLQARVVSTYTPGWEVFRVKSSTKKWFSNPELNLGFTIKVLDSTGLEWPYRRVHRLQNHRNPILVVFSKDPITTEGTTHTQKVQQDSISLQSISAWENLVTQNVSEVTSARSPRSASPIPEYELCAKHELKVDFDKLGWSSWIISPKWYDAFVCTGACAFPLGQNLRPTNHATVQSIVHELGLTDGVSAPCCVPTELHPVSLLYFDEHSNVVLKQYEDMVAARCGCQ